MGNGQSILTAFDHARALVGAGHSDQAEQICRRALQDSPGAADLWHLLGVIAHNRDDRAAAAEHLGRAVALRPDDAEALGNLARVLFRAGRMPEAVTAICRYLALRPDDADAWGRLGDALRRLDRFGEAADAYRAAIAGGASDAETHTNYAGTLLALGRDGEALPACRAALARDPEGLSAGLNLAVALARCGDLDAATAACRAASARHSHDPRGHRTLALLYKDQGMTSAAVASYRRALALDPGNAATHSAMLFLMLYDPACDHRQVLAEHRRWAERHADPLTARAAPHDNGPEPERRLRIGYVSADFCYHSKAEAFAPLIEHFDRDRFEVICYSGTPRPDPHTAGFRRAASGWCDSRELDDAALAAQVRRDRIDILVDLSGHSHGNRLLAFARKPAPLQVAWLDVTGLPAMDYLFADPVLWPPDDGPLTPEAVYGLAHGGLGYRPPAAAPPVAPTPAPGRGRVTFGSFNSALKLGPPVVDAWAQILARLPSARLMLKNPSFDDAKLRDRYRRAFADRGVAPQRIEFRGRTGHQAQLAAYGEIDIALDTFPGNGGVTTWEALWMGLPVVALRGHPPAGNNGAAILTSVGLTELIAETVDAYAALAVRLAADPPGLAARRAGQRRLVAAAPVLDPRRYVRTVEDAYRTIWRRWCARRLGRRS
jgi:predicted O-linked N-acetylglucosamine transferase (SPINDLY family)